MNPSTYEYWDDEQSSAAPRPGASTEQRGGAERATNVSGTWQPLGGASRAGGAPGRPSASGSGSGSGSGASREAHKVQKSLLAFTVQQGGAAQNGRVGGSGSAAARASNSANKLFSSSATPALLHGVYQKEGSMEGSWSAGSMQGSCSEGSSSRGVSGGWTCPKCSVRAHLTRTHIHTEIV
jgi:hypothetical protein